jgi:oligosaccharide reducing-end xylanase
MLKSWSQPRAQFVSLAGFALVGLLAACSSPDNGPSAAQLPAFGGPANNPANTPAATNPNPSGTTEPGPSGTPVVEGQGEGPMDLTGVGNTTPGTGTPTEPPTGTEPPATTEPPPTGDPTTMPPVEQPPVVPPPTGPLLEQGTGTRNLFTEVLGIPQAEVDDKLRTAVNRFFGIGTGEANNPVVNGGYRVYYELPQDPNRAFIWAADSSDIRSEGMSYGMFIAVQMDMQQQFDRLWNFAKQHMQFAANSTGNLAAWRYYFRWQGSVNTGNANNWQVNYANDGPAPDGEEYFAASLYLANRRWGSAGAINYLQEASNITAAMLNNAAAGGNTPVIDRASNMVVFFPSGGAAQYSDPSYHLPAFYERLFAQDGPQADRQRWLQIAEVSRQFFVNSDNNATGLHPDYARFNGAPEAGGDAHDQFRYDAWRVPMNMAIDFAWVSQDARMRTQVEKYHTFFINHLGTDNVTNALFALDGSGASGGSSTALTATLAAGALASNNPNIQTYVDNLWNVGQQQGQYRYYQECVYLLGLLATSGHYSYQWP